MSKPLWQRVAMHSAIAVCFLAAGAAAQQAQNAQPAPAQALAFEVASIKPSPDIQSVMASGQMPHVGMHVDGAQVNIGFFSLAQIICQAYDIKTFQLEGPDWMKTERFDIEAKMPEGATDKQVPQMLQALLADRFKLTIHRETRDHDVYALVVGKDGPKLQPAIDSPPPPPPDTPADKNEMVIGTGSDQMRIKSTANGNPMAGGSSTTTIAGGRNGPMKVTMVDGVMHLEVGKMSMDEFAQSLTPYLDRPAVNKTGLTGNYQISLEASMQDLMTAARASGITMPAMGLGAASAAGDPNTPPTAADPGSHSVFESVQKLGLKLDPQKLPIDFVVVDHLEKQPTEN